MEFYGRFFDEELSAFINKDRWKVNQGELKGVNISDKFIKYLKKIDEEISSVLFKGGNLNVSFQLKPLLPQSRPTGNKVPFVEQVYLNLDGYENTYKMGTQSWTFYSWPGNRGAPGARMNISLSDYGTSDTKYFEGDWALFKLLGDASVSQGESSSQLIFNWIFYKNNFYDVTVSYILKAASSRNPFSENFFKSFSLPNKIN